MSSYYGLILVILTSVSGIIWLIDIFTTGKKRKDAVAQLYAQTSTPSVEALAAVSKEPIHVDYAKSFFPILFIIVFFRSFLFEPFQIPSASMKPTLTEGDFILVNKYNYGLRLPVTSSKIFEVGLPQRGDVAVFKPPHRPHEDYIKRIIGIPGDKVIYTRDKELYVIPHCPNGTLPSECPKKIHMQKSLVDSEYLDTNPDTGITKVNHHYSETINGVEHGILNRPGVRYVNQFGNEYDMEFNVPEKSYFVMGDNRDNSQDSRLWPNGMHFVAEDQLVGQAVFIWMHLDFGLKTPYLTWVPTGIDIQRIGAIK